MLNRKYIFILALGIWFIISASISRADERQCVILLHGLARSHNSMSSLESILKLHNYIVINNDYPTTKKSIDELASQYLPNMVDACLKHHPDHIHIVTHSLGGIVLQKYLQKHQIPTLSRIVMLGPPNHGSPLADLWHNNWLFRKSTGPAGQELTTRNNSTPNTMHLDQDYQIGIIAGNFSFNPLSKLIFHEENDGKVSVSSTQSESMKDFIILPVSHTFMMKNHTVENQVLYFLAYGRFLHKNQSH